MRITIGGLPGSGTSTTAYLLKEKTDMEVISAGETFRALAKEKGVSLAKFGDLAKVDDSIDRSLDNRMLETARANENIILEGRLIGPLCKKNSIPVVAIWQHAPIEVRAERISERESVDLKTTTKRMIERERSERTRYIDYYSLDNQDLSHYDLVVSSYHNSPEEIVANILEAMK